MIMRKAAAVAAGEDGDEPLVLSDVHIGHTAGAATGRSRFSYTTSVGSRETLTIAHSLATPLKLVGLQVWSGAFLLADYLLAHQERFRDCVALEVGSGPGVAGIVMARVARRCYLTDGPEEVLHLLKRNIEANRHLFRNDSASASITDTNAQTPCDGSGDHAQQQQTPCDGSKEQQCSPVARARRLDWFQASAATLGGAGFGGARAPFHWRAEELRDLRALDVVLASDVVYDEDAVSALFDTLALLLPPPPPPPPAAAAAAATAAAAAAAAGVGVRDARRRPVVLLALEKRFNFSLEELSVVATGYRAMLAGVRDVDAADAAQQEPCTSPPLPPPLPPVSRETMEAAPQSSQQQQQQQRQQPLQQQQRSGVATGAAAVRPEFEGRRLPLTFAQHFASYARTPQMELWEIWRR